MNKIYSKSNNTTQTPPQHIRWEKINLWASLKRNSNTQQSIRIQKFKIPSHIPKGKGSLSLKQLTAIRDQGSCKAGGPMSVASAVDAFYSINKKQKIYSSAQQLIDCNEDESNCENPSNVLFSLYHVEHNGLTSDAKYPFVGKQQACKFPQGEYNINSDVAAMKEALVTGPVNVAVDASKWQFYKSGVFSNCGTQANHYVLGVGYDVNGNWFAQNSFGTGWGQNGYIILAPGNTCGILEDGYQIL